MGSVIPLWAAGPIVGLDLVAVFLAILILTGWLALAMTDPAETR